MPKEYIERGALIDELEHLHEDAELSYLGVYDCVKTIPTADLVEVVRCKDCEYQNEWIKNGLGEYFCRRSGLWCLTDNHFCSYGERKDK